ncbi:MAG: PE domain-containing protein [Nocardia sp.]|nr:PE domain-containing protein [Nocardia sp.]
MLEISPEALPVISSTLQAAHMSLTTVTQGASVIAMPMTPATDHVSQEIVAAFAAFHPRFFTDTNQGLSYLLAGAQVLVPVSESYQAGDASGGQQVSSVSLA